MLFGAGDDLILGVLQSSGRLSRFWLLCGCIVLQLFEVLPVCNFLSASAGSCLRNPVDELVVV